MDYTKVISRLEAAGEGRRYDYAQSLDRVVEEMRWVEDGIKAYFGHKPSFMEIVEVYKLVDADRRLENERR